MDRGFKLSDHKFLGMKRKNYFYEYLVIFLHFKLKKFFSKKFQITPKNFMCNFKIYLMPVKYIWKLLVNQQNR